MDLMFLPNLSDHRKRTDNLAKSGSFLYWQMLLECMRNLPSQIRWRLERYHKGEMHREYIIECLKGIPVISCQVILLKVFEIRH